MNLLYILFPKKISGLFGIHLIVFHVNISSKTQGKMLAHNTAQYSIL